MAGSGSRFSVAGYEVPKPFIDVAGKPMIVRVMENLCLPEANFFLISRREHLENQKNLIADIQSRFKSTFIPIDKQTEGTACTVLYARSLLDLNGPVVIANSDQIVDDSFVQFIQDAQLRDLDGSILTFIDEEFNPKWSFVESNKQGYVMQVKEKEVISQYATVGIYYFRRANELIDAIVQMIIENDRTNNEFYVCPVYNYLIRNGKRIGTYTINKSQMHGLGTPEDLKKFLLEN